MDGERETAEAVDDWSGRGFLARTLRTSATVAAIVVLVLLSYGLIWAIGPFLAGLILSAVLLGSWDVFVRSLLTPPTRNDGSEPVRRNKQKGIGRKGTIFVFSLIKYPLVGLLLYVAVWLWRGDPHRALAFIGGFILLHLVIGLRAINRMLIDSRNTTRNTKG